MVTPADIEKWNPDKLLAVIGTAESAHKSLEKLGENYDGTKRSLSDWGGLTAEAWKAQHGKLRTDITEQGRQAKAVADAMKPSMTRSWPSSASTKTSRGLSSEMRHSTARVPPSTGNSIRTALSTRVARPWITSPRWSNRTSNNVCRMSWPGQPLSMRTSQMHCVPLPPAVCQPSAARCQQTNQRTSPSPRRKTHRCWRLGPWVGRMETRHIPMGPRRP